VASLFPGHPAGQSVTPESLERVTEDQVKDWVRQNLRPERATLVVVSDREPDDRFWKDVEEWYGDIRAKGDPQPFYPLAPSSSPKGRKVVVVDQPTATQPLLRVGIALPPVAARDDAALAVLGRTLTSTLERRLRESSGITYSASVGRIDRGNSAAFVASTAVEEAALVPTVKVVLDALAGSTGITVEDPDVRRASFREARKMGLAFDGVGRSADALQSLVLGGLPDDHWEGYASRLVSLDTSRLQAAARSLAIGREVIVGVGAAARVRPLLEAAGYVVEVVPEPPPEPADAGKDAKPADVAAVDVKNLTGM
jgi:zinc protease